MTLGTGKGTHPGSVVYAGGDALGLQRRDHRTLVAAGALADDMDRTPAFCLETAQMGEEAAVTLWGICQGKCFARKIDLQSQLGNVQVRTRRGLGWPA